MRRAFAVIFVLALLGACTRRHESYGSCNDVFDCRSGQTCRAGLCEVEPGLAAQALAVELIPASSNADQVKVSPIRQEIPKLALGDAYEVDLEFVEPATLSGRVIVGGSPDFPSIAASVTITRRSAIGLPDLIYSADAAEGRLQGETSFRLPLPPTDTTDDADCDAPEADCYELRVVPEDLHAIPPLVRRLALPESKNVDISLAGAGEALRVSGTIFDATLSQPQPGLEVRIVDASGRTVSSVATTSPDTPANADAGRVGAFQLTVQRDLPAGDYWLEIAGSQDHPGMPTFLTKQDVATGDNVDLGDLALLPFKETLASMAYQVQGPASNGQDEPVAGAQVRFTTYLGAEFLLDAPAGCAEGMCAIFSRQAATDAAGEVKLDLIPGEYHVRIVPGSNSPYSAFSGEVEVGSAGFGAPFMLARKLEITGTVFDQSGVPVAGATVSATAHEVPVPAGVTKRDPADLGIDEPPSSKQTDASGRFLLAVEPGVTYDVTVIPPFGSTAPIWTLPPQAFTASQRLDITLPPAALLMGGIVDWNGEAQGGVLVRLYSMVRDPDTGVTASWLSGEAVSGDDGRYALVLPASE